MKARVKATGEIVEVEWRYLANLNGFDSVRYVDQKTGISYFECDLDFYIKGQFTENCLNGIKQDQDIVHEPDYWTRLEHQYAGMAMQALLSSDTMMEILSRRDNGTMEEEVAREAFDYAHALVEKMKEERE